MSAPLCRGIINWQMYYWAMEMDRKYNKDLYDRVFNVDYSKYLPPSTIPKSATDVGAPEGSLPKPTTKHQG